MNFEEVTQYTKNKAKENEENYIVYEIVSSGIEDDFVVSKEKIGVPTSYKGLDREIKVLLRVGKNGEVLETVSESFEDSEYKEQDPVICKIIEEDKQIVTIISEVTKQAIKTHNGLTFKKSNMKSGWGSKESKIMKKLEKSDTDRFDLDPDLENIEEGDYILTSECKVLRVKGVSKRQVKSSSANFRKSDGLVWGNKTNIKIIKIFKN